MATAAIAGGGIGGMAAAVALATAGWQVVVVERAARLEEVGAGLQLSPNACRALRAPGLLPRIQQRATSPAAAELRDGESGSLVFSLPLGSDAQERWRAPYLHVHRADLLDAFVVAARDAGVELRLGARVERLTEQGGRVHMRLQDGTELETDLGIVADGIRSHLRMAVAPPGAPDFAGQVAWRALVPGDAVAGLDLPQAATVWAGSGRHLVTYRLRGEALINIVAVEEREEPADEGWVAADDPAALRAAFAGWHPAVTGLLERVETCHLWGLYDRPPPGRMAAGRICLLGDAAHPMVPFMAQGAAMAIEDAAVLTRKLGLTDDIAEATAAYEEVRLPRIARVMARTLANGRLYHHPPGLGRMLARSPLSFAARHAPGLLYRGLDWLYGYDAMTA